MLCGYNRTELNRIEWDGMEWDGRNGTQRETEMMMEDDDGLRFERRPLTLNAYTAGKLNLGQPEAGATKTRERESGRCAVERNRPGFSMGGPKVTADRETTNFMRQLYE